MTEQVQMNFPLMEDMARSFGTGAQVLENTLAEVNSIAAALEDGGLLGGAGYTFAEACRGPLTMAIDELRKKFEELQTDIIAAKEAMETADATTKGYYQ